MDSQLPRGSRMPPALQTLGAWTHPTTYPERVRARYGPRFTVRFLGQVPVIERCEIQPAGERAEATRKRSIITSPARGARVVLRGRP